MTDARDRLLAKVVKAGDCWLWTGASKPKGYGNFYLQGKYWNTHRASYAVFVGEIPSGIQVLHKCDTPRCINPDHLFLGTQKDNGEDMARKERSRLTKLTASLVKEIRKERDNGRTLVDLSAQYGVTFSTIGHICRRDTWRHVTDEVFA